MNQNGRRRSSIEFDTFAGKKVCQVLFELVLMSFRGFLFQKSSIGMHFLYKFPGSNFYVVSGDFLRTQPSHGDFFSQSHKIRSSVSIAFSGKTKMSSVSSGHIEIKSDAKKRN